MNPVSTKQYESSGQTQVIELTEIHAQSPAGPTLLAGRLGLLHDVKVTLNVVVGGIDTTLGELMHLQEASVLKLDRQVDQPVDILVNGNVVARGQLVVVDDQFGVRITEISTAAHA